MTQGNGSVSEQVWSLRSLYSHLFLPTTIINHNIDFSLLGQISPCTSVPNIKRLRPFSAKTYFGSKPCASDLQFRVPVLKHNSSQYTALYLYLIFLAPRNLAKASLQHDYLTLFLDYPNLTNMAEKLIQRFAAEHL
jgi:hypothetical protein